MKYWIIGFLSGLMGYGIAALLGFGGVVMLSSNQFDKSLEASMTSAFVFGPLGFIFLAIVGYRVARKRF